MVDAAPPTSSHQLHWWKNPRWIVIRIEALVVVAIIISFFLASFGSCRRWSNRWIIQKGFFVAQVLSLSLGTYSIGLMQSSSVKSEMYPIWTVSLFTLFGCIDPVTTYNGLDYKGPLIKAVFGICLNCGYVLLMSISTISSGVGNTAIITLSAITFIKSFHRSFALVEQKKLCDMVFIDLYSGGRDIFIKDKRHWIATQIGNNKVLLSCYDMWVAVCLSHKLRRYILGLDYHVPTPLITLLDMDMKWALKVIEIELALVYDALFTGNPFLHYYQARTASLWALASFAGICFVLAATAIPGGLTRRSGATGCTIVVGTTTADLAITFGILVSLALLQLTQLVRSWTSNWARATIFCACTGEDEEKIPTIPDFQRLLWRHLKLSGWMRLKALVATSTNLFEKYLWQDKISQYSILPEPRLLAGRERKGEGISSLKAKGERIWWSSAKGERIRKRCVDWVQMFGLHYIWQVIWELLSSDTNKRGGVKLDEDVKGSVIDFLCHIHSNRLDNNWLWSLPEEPKIRYFLPQFSAPWLLRPEDHCYRYISCVMTWHIATWYCELEERKQAEAPICCGKETATSYYLRKAGAAIRRLGNYFQKKKQKRGGEEGEGGTKSRDHRRVANALSQYCVYLVKSAPELLPGPVAWTKRVYECFACDAKVIARLWQSYCLSDIEDSNTIRTIRGNMSDRIVCNEWRAQKMNYANIADYRIPNCKALAKLLLKRRPDELWKTLALVWVQLLVYAAPYGNVEAHMRHLSQGGEFITHLWALLYHLDIREWKPLEVNNLHDDISTVEDAKRILNRDDHDHDIVVFYVTKYLPQEYRDDFVTASKLVDGVKIYLTSSPDVAECLFPESILKSTKGILFLIKADNETTFYDHEVHGWYTTWNIAQFVYENTLASAKARAQETAPSTSHNPIPIEKQSSEDGQTSTVVEIEEEIPLPS